MISAFAFKTYRNAKESWRVLTQQFLYFPFLGMVSPFPLPLQHYHLALTNKLNREKKWSIC